MARHVLIIERSDAQRRKLQADILAVLDDVIISEAASIDIALPIIEKSTVHLVLYGWYGNDQAGLSFCAKDLPGLSRDPIPYLLLVNSKTEKPMDFEGVELECLMQPSTSSELAEAINFACNPVGLRKTKRYSIPGLRGRIEQRNISFETEILNISVGGVLCEFEIGSEFNCIDPLVISICFDLKEEELLAEQLYSVISSLKVVVRNTDHTPRRIRAGFHFLNIPDSARSILDQIFERIDNGHEIKVVGSC